VLFEKELLKAKAIDIKLLAATLILAKKMIDKEKLNELWEEIKMLDIIDSPEKSRTNRIKKRRRSRIKVRQGISVGKGF